MTYRKYADDLRAKMDGIILPFSGVHWKFYMPMPRSWSKRERLRLLGQPHRISPDVDNLLKAVLDSLYTKATGGDAHIWDVRASKLWAEFGQIVVSYETN
jgi:Holliday junction resolvase RusA-like endonuclease